MNTPPPSRPAPSQRGAADDSQIRAWLRLRQELAELHAQLEYVRLIVSLGVRQAHDSAAAAAQRGAAGSRN